MADYAVHVAGKAEGLLQRCAHCGAVLLDRRGEVIPASTGEAPRWLTGNVAVLEGLQEETTEAPTCTRMNFWDHVSRAIDFVMGFGSVFFVGYIMMVAVLGIFFLGPVQQVVQAVSRTTGLEPMASLAVLVLSPPVLVAVAIVMTYAAFKSGDLARRRE